MSPWLQSQSERRMCQVRTRESHLLIVPTEKKKEVGGQQGCAGLAASCSLQEEQKELEEEVQRRPDCLQRAGAAPRFSP